MKTQILKTGKKYTFSDYFELNNPTEDIVAVLKNASYQALNLPKSTNYNTQKIKELQDILYTILPKITINSEIAKREFLIAPILVEIARSTDYKINVEYTLDVDEKLSGCS